MGHAWHQQAFTCKLGGASLLSSPRPAASAGATTGAGATGSGGAGADADAVMGGGDDGCHVCEVHSTRSDEGVVVIIRDVTDRLRRQEAEKAVLRAAIERQKDEEANRFTRHEVKNGVLAALSLCESLRQHHETAAAEGVLASLPAVASTPEEAAAYSDGVRSRLTGLHSGLNQTFEAVLSEAMAREVVHGLYVARTEPVKVDDALRLSVATTASGASGNGANGSGRNERFVVKTFPPVLPVVDLDPRLLLHTYRNAVSNACKYGRAGGVVTTEIIQVGADETLTIRVINEPGVGHEALMALHDCNVVFAKGTRFHTAAMTPSTATARTSKGDGAWIMAKCVESLQGACSISFEASRTVFEMTCPALECRDESFIESAALGPMVYGLAADDCEFQRFILTQLFAQAGVAPTQVRVTGGTAAEIEGLADTLVRLLEHELPAGAYLLAIIDENLDLPAPLYDTVSGSCAVEAARARLSPDREGRLLALVRSANDSADDQRLYTERAHGFLSKSPSEPERVAVLRAWVRRFGQSGLAHIACAHGEPDGGVLAAAGAADADDPAAAHRAAAAAELTRISRLVDEGWRAMRWAETWRWLHRIKGVVGSVKVHDPARAAQLIADVEGLRLRHGTPSDFEHVWAELKCQMTTFTVL